MTPLTTEQVKKLRLPAWFELVPTREVVKNTIPEGVLCRCEPWTGRTKDDSGDAFRAPKSEIALAQIAEHCANGHLPPEALDDVWRRVDGKPSREAELLRVLVFELEQEDLVKCGTATEAMCAMTRVRVATQAARKWIEEQKP